MASSFVGLGDNNVLVSFNSNNLSRVSSIPVTGVDGPLLGIDTRPANGLIYGITAANTIYTINPNTGIATKVSTLSTPFTGTSVSGFDFNPVADRLRLVGDNDQNFRINVDTGAVTVDGNLAFAGGDINVGVNPSITAAAYTNSFAGATTTQLYNIDEAQDILVLQNPPNNGVLATVGRLGVDFGPLGGFDIVSSPPDNNAAFATSNGKIYSINLSTGAATNLGTIGSSTNQIFKGLVAGPAPDIDPIAVNSQFLGLTNDNKLISFNPSSPNRTTTIAVAGVDGPLLGIDTRPANGLIYGITTANTIYTINPNTGIATKVSTLSTPFTGTSVSGFDFNPVADRLRLVGDNDQSFRINVDTGAVTVDGNLAYAAGDANFGANPTVTAAAYTNAIASPTSTQLYDIDTSLDVLTLQNPPNNGTLTTIGSLGTNFDILAGFDIISTSNGNNAAFALTNSTLYSIDLLTGKATNLGAIVSSSADTSKLQGLATIDSSKIVDPIATNYRFLALANDNTLASFNPSNPSAVRSIAVTGLKSGETLLGIDTRPANGLIYGLTTASNIYTVNPNSGAASLVSTLSQPFTGTSATGFDFNPVADRLRLVGDDDRDFRINVDTGAVTVDGNLAYAAGDINFGANPAVTAVAYTNAIASPTATQLYDIDTNLDVLTLQNPPNNGTLTTVGSLGINFDTSAGFDIISAADGTNAAFAVSNSTLYSINLQTGAASSLGTIGGGKTYQGLATVSTRRNDFNGDGKTDVVVRNKATGENAFALLNNTTVSQFVFTTPQADLNWTIDGAGDFDKDGKTDVVLRNKATGQNAIALLDGTVVSQIVNPVILPDPNWGIGGVGDFNNDGNVDILYRNKATGDNAFALMNGTNLIQVIAAQPVPDLNWEIGGVGDFNKDGKDDVVFRNKATGENAFALLNGTSVLQVVQAQPVPDLNWTIGAVGDYNNDGNTDVLFRNQVTGENTFALLNGTNVSQLVPTLTIADTNWVIGA